MPTKKKKKKKTPRILTVNNQPSDRVLILIDRNNGTISGRDGVIAADSGVIQQ